MKAAPPSIEPSWLETMASVTSCTYEFGATKALAFGIPEDNHFLIGFSYHAHGKDFTGEFRSPVALEQGHLFSIRYNPLAPQQNTKTATLPTVRTPFFAIGIAGSVILSLLYLMLMRGCH
jgi:hypothetical protein